MRSTGIPLRGGRKARVHVGVALGNHTDLERTAHTDNGRIRSALRSQRTAKRSHRFARMGTTGDHPGVCGIVGTYLDWLRRPSALLAPGALPLRREITCPRTRAEDHTQYRSAFLCQTDIHRELPITANEFLGAVQWVHQPNPRTFKAPFVIDILGFFRDDQDFWRQYL